MTSDAGSHLRARSHPTRAAALAAALATLAATAASHGQARAAAAAAQSAPTAPPPRANGVYADLGLHVIGVGYERVVHPIVSLQIAAEYYVPWTVNRNVLGLGGEAWGSERSAQGAGARARAFVFVLGRAPRGLFLSPFAQLMYVYARQGSETGTGTAWAVGVSGGYSFVVGDAVAVRLGAGIQYHQADVAAGGRAQGFGGPFPQIDAQVGYVF